MDPRTETAGLSRKRRDTASGQVARIDQPHPPGVPGESPPLTPSQHTREELLAAASPRLAGAERGPSVPWPVGAERGPSARPSREQLLVAAGLGAGPALEQLQTQAEELGEQLRSRQRELDRREATLNARSLEIDAQLRKARLVTSEREEELKSRDEGLQRRQAELDERAAALAAAELVLERQRQQFEDWADQQSQTFHHRDVVLAEQQERLAEQRQALERAAQEAAEQAERQRQQIQRQTQQLQADRRRAAALLRRRRGQGQQQQAELQARAAQVDQTEVLVNEHLRQLDHDRQRFVTDAAELRRTFAERERALVAGQQQAEQQLRAAKQKLEERTRAVEHREAVLEQLQRELTRRHGEVLELRLVAEELWAKLSRTVPAKELAASVRALRQQLADHYRLAQAALDEKEQSLAQLATRVAEQQRTLARHRQELQDWLHHRQTELEEQTLALAAREEEFLQKRWEYWDRQQQWIRERQDLQRQLRDLRQPASSDRPAAGAGR